VYSVNTAGQQNEKRDLFKTDIPFPGGIDLIGGVPNDHDEPGIS
jgi:hypothetical protein